MAGMGGTTLLVLLALAIPAAVLGRLLGGFSLAGCLINYIFALLGAIAGWVLQARLFGPDNLVVLPISGGVAVSIVGATIGAVALAFVGGLLARPSARPLRSRRR